jgi:hypothetical protein
MRVSAPQRGIALIIVLLAIALLSAIALGLTLSSTLETLTTANYDEAVAMLNASESALELAARELATVNFDDVLRGAQTSMFVDGAPGPRTTAAGVNVDLVALTQQLTCGRAMACTDAQVRQHSADRPWGSNNPRWRLFVHQPLSAPALPRRPTSAYIVVWIGDDARETDDDPARDGAGEGQEGRYVVRARAEAFGPRGARHAIEAELARVCVDQAAEMCVPGSHVQSWRAVSALVP